LRYLDSIAPSMSLQELLAQTVDASLPYGTRYIERANAIEIDPVALGLAHKADVKGKALLPPAGLPLQ